MLEVRIIKQLPDFTLQVDTRFDRGMHIIIGPSGAGKTTLLECISGIRTPDTGTITLSGVPLFSKSENVNVPVHKRRIGYVFQEYALFPHLTVRQNLLYAKNPDIEHRLQKSAERLGILPLLSRYPRDLSGGEQQRVALGRALLMEPQVLLLDEPFSALDADTRQKVIPLVQDVIEQLDIPTLLITHQNEVAKTFAAPILRLERGQFVVENSNIAPADGE